MTWILHGFEKDGDALTHEVNVDEALRKVFRNLLHQPDSDPMYDSFALDETVVARINEMLDLHLDTADADYFLDYRLEFQERRTE